MLFRRCRLHGLICLSVLINPKHTRIFVGSFYPETLILLVGLCGILCPGYLSAAPWAVLVLLLSSTNEPWRGWQEVGAGGPGVQERRGASFVGPCASFGLMPVQLLPSQRCKGLAKGPPSSLSLQDLGTSRPFPEERSSQGALGRG